MRSETRPWLVDAGSQLSNLPLFLRFTQSPPSTYGSEPAAAATVPRATACNVTASAFVLTSWYLRTCTVLSCGETPLTSRSAPDVVLVVATLHAGSFAERVEAGDFGKVDAVAVLHRTVQVHRRATVQRRAARIDLDRAGPRQLADDDPLGAAERSGEPAGRQRDAAPIANRRTAGSRRCSSAGWCRPGCTCAAAAAPVAGTIGVISEKSKTFTCAGLPGPGAVTMLLRPDTKSTKPELTLTPDRSSGYGLKVEKSGGAVPVATAAPSRTP